MRQTFGISTLGAAMAVAASALVADGPVRAQANPQATRGPAPARPGTAAAPAPAKAAGVELAQCWWRTSTGAVRIGELFTATLTCAVVQTPKLEIIVDETRLDPGAIQLSPFEVVGGSHAPDVRTGDHRFFQYQYQLRLISGDFFGRDAPFPELRVRYRIQTEAAAGAALQGKDLAVVLQPEAMRVLSLVPTEAPDIREASAGTFDDIEALRFRASALRIAAGVLAVLAAGLLIPAFVRAARGERVTHKAAQAVLSDTAILRAAGGELSSVSRAAARSGWSEALVGRALAALRLVAAYALGRRVSQSAPGSDGQMDGQLLVRGGLLRGTRVIASSMLTPEAIASALAAMPADDERRERLGELRTALSTLADARYAPASELDGGRLDDAVAAGLRLNRQVKRDHGWIAKLTTTLLQTAAEMRDRVWSR